MQYFDGPSMENLVKQSKDLLSPNGALVHMSIPDLKHYYRAMVSESPTFGSLLKATVKLFFALSDRDKSYGKFGFWWSTDLLINAHEKDYESVRCLSSDAWYRFDLICSGKKN